VKQGLGVRMGGGGWNRLGAGENGRCLVEMAGIGGNGLYGWKRMRVDGIRRVWVKMGEAEWVWMR